MTLTPDEIRVLGVLLEKQMSQPAQYPMTLNALTVACNQKSNRDPVTTLSEGQVGAALHGLQRWQLAAQAPPERGSRANRFQHQVEQRFAWTGPEKAILCELMIRGPQTVGELRTHAGRLFHLESTEYVREVLGELERADPPRVRELPRQPGQSATRFMHLLGGESIENAAAVGAADAAARAPSSAAVAPRAASVDFRTGEMTASGDEDSRVVDDLRSQLASVQSELAELRARLCALEDGVRAVRDQQ